MRNDFRALCAELTEFVARLTKHYYEPAELLTRARAALADGPAVPTPPAALPEGYIDPEHSGDDRALLQTFYSTCLAEGGTADEITLRGLRAVLADGPAVPEGREPASVTGQPSDQEGPSAEDVEELCEEHCFNVEGYESIECLQGLINEAIDRWGNPAPLPPAEPAVPEGREPTRDELWELWLRLSNELPDRPAAVAEFWEHAQIDARARWGNPAPQPPAKGEVEE